MKNPSTRMTMNPPPAIEARDGAAVWIRVRVQPKASRDAMSIENDGRIRVALCAPPVDGAANTALCAFFAKTLGIAKSKVSVVKGEKSRDKVIAVEGLSFAFVTEKLEC